MCTGSVPEFSLFAQAAAGRPEPQPSAPLALVEAPVASVALLQKVDRIYSYSIPAALAGTLRPGCRVKVPLGKSNRLAEGYCVQVSQDGWKSTLKSVAQQVDPQPLLSNHMIDLGVWIARYYACSLGLTLDAMVPAGAKVDARPSTVRCAVWAGSADPQSLGDLPAAQTRIAEILLPIAPEPIPTAKLLAQAHCTQAPLKSLAGKGLVRLLDQEDGDIAARLLSPADTVEATYSLNPDQEKAYNRAAAAVQAGVFHVMLLYGVTGSGKTEVYIRAIRDCLAAGRQALLLVPEIGLTTQTVSRLAGRLPHLVGLHSGLSDSQRSRAWQLIGSGQAKVVVGTRSTVFAPCPNLGLIVIDEEQESSYKNMQAPRFHSRDVAIKRAQLLGIPVLLGSATPSLETWLNAHQMPHYELIRLPSRVKGLPLPSVSVVDMREEHRQRSGIHLLSRLMEQKLGETLGRGEQAVLLLNRRGYASYVFCPSCGRRVVCPRCKVNMVFHQAAERAVCHYCNSQFPVPTKCSAPGCGHKLVRFGMGTQRVEAELQEKFPQARVARVDSDVMNKAAEFAALLTEFEGGRLDVLIGTQMVAKGLDFPFVSFVGVISADTSLSLPDFRAAERTFQLVTQVAGRAGRSEIPGSVVVQTFASDLAAIKTALHHDFERFAHIELASRQKMRFPPYVRLARVLLEDRRLPRVREESERLAQAIHSCLPNLPEPADFIGPQPSPIEKVRDRYRYDILLRAGTARSMQALLDRLRGKKCLDAKVERIILDVDPVGLL
jgi:primosomal protein N' (replication factor Y) (superfamily II helicase)